MIGYFDEELNPLYPTDFVFNGVQYPVGAYQVMTDDELSAVGRYRGYADETETPAGKTISSYTLKIVGNKVVGVPVFKDIEKYVPQTVSRAQGKAALLRRGLLTQVRDYINNMPEGDEKEMAQLAFNETNEFRRDSPFLQDIATQFGLSSEQLDDLFILGDSIIL